MEETGKRYPVAVEGLVKGRRHFFAVCERHPTLQCQRDLQICARRLTHRSFFFFDAPHPPLLPSLSPSLRKGPFLILCVDDYPAVPLALMPSSPLFLVSFPFPAHHPPSPYAHRCRHRTEENRRLRKAKQMSLNMLLFSSFSFLLLRFI